MTGAMRRGWRRLRASERGVAATEFALVIPFLLTAGLTGLEVGNRVMVQMQIGQLAVHIADNASRVGDQSMLQDRRIYESDINDVFAGAERQGGRGLDLYEHGRVIISSQQVVPTTDDDQFIKWQRCMGEKNHPSSYGEENDGLSGSFAGMGEPGQEIYAFADQAVIFVEVAYDYQPIFGLPFGFDAEIIATAAYTVRDDRDISQIYQRDPDSPDDLALCNEYGGSSYSS
jgi:hypothetical protein